MIGPTKVYPVLGEYLKGKTTDGDFGLEIYHAGEKDNLLHAHKAWKIMCSMIVRISRRRTIIFCAEPPCRRDEKDVVISMKCKFFIDADNPYNKPAYRTMFDNNV